VEEVIAFGEKAAGELSDIELSDERINALEKELAHVYNEMTGLSEKLSALRKKTALEAGARIEEELRFLNMPKAHFSIGITELPDFGPDGRDCVEFMFSANAGRSCGLYQNRLGRRAVEGHAGPALGFDRCG
jgi:DNA repair protein RecN (Recombination protein N)